MPQLEFQLLYSPFHLIHDFFHQVIDFFGVMLHSEVYMIYSHLQVQIFCLQDQQFYLYSALRSQQIIYLLWPTPHSPYLIHPMPSLILTILS
jgi:hypothetical protein